MTATPTAYAIVAQVRLRELRTRIALAAFIGVMAWFLAPTPWPLVWFVGVLATQIVDWLVFRPLRQRPDIEPSTGYKVLCCATAALNVIVYSAIALCLWLNGGEAARLFAMVQVAGGLLHVSLHMHHVRALLLSAFIPHATYFLGLPVLGAMLSGKPAEAAISLGGILYLAHLVVAVRQSSHTTRALRTANAAADQERRNAEAASAAKSDFLAVISHEIRTPMNAVISAANLLKRTRLNRGQREHVAMLLDAGDVLVGLLNDVLDFSKIEAGKMTLEVTDFDVRSKLAGLERLWAPKAHSKGVSLRVRVDDDAPALVRTDSLRLQQILFNLLSNAVKFTERGSITVHVQWRRDGRLVIEVEDTGCGIPEDQLERVFVSFEQADAGTTRRYGGTGLGLAISRRLAEVMGGELTVVSVEGRGSTFRLSLPVTAAEAGEEALPRVAGEVSLSGRQFLAADDHPVNRRILALLLEPFGCELTLVENGQEAVEAAAVRRFDGVIMDMQMPVMDGLEASRAIRAAGPNRDTPIIALTANAMDSHRAAWDSIGVSAFLTKPIDPVLLAGALMAACEARADEEFQEAG